MHYVILRDDDTNALTPVDCLERLYRPFLERGLPVNLATIPCVRTNVRNRSGAPEGYLLAKSGNAPLVSRVDVPIGSNPELVRYLLDNPDYHIVQHGYDHSPDEFDSNSVNDVCHRLDEGTRLLIEAGFSAPQTFVAPYDKLSRASLRETAKRFRVVSTGWFELRRLPLTWFPRYAFRKLTQAPHWRIGQTALLTHPGCLLSCYRSRDTMLEEIKRSVQSQGLTVLVTHWWEYFRNQEPDEPFIQILHETAAWLASRSDIRLVSFDNIAAHRVRLN